ncbi:hypothetical protein BH10CYA1_BH10CYA1_45030 [soil metagenome]
MRQALDNLAPPKDKSHEAVPLADHIFNSIFDAQVKVLDPKAKAMEVHGALDIEEANKKDKTMSKYAASVIAMTSIDGQPDDAKRKGHAAGDQLINRVIEPEKKADSAKPQVELVAVKQTEAPWNRDYSKWAA